jgi:hypothetical protein
MPAAGIQHVSFEELAVPLFDELYNVAHRLTRSTLRRHPSETRTGCANQCPPGSVRGVPRQVVSLPRSPIIYRIQSDRDAQTRSLAGVLPLDDRFLTTGAEYVSSLRSPLLNAPRDLPSANCFQMSISNDSTAMLLQPNLVLDSRRGRKPGPRFLKLAWTTGPSN